jgi:hypothetical protein
MATHVTSLLRNGPRSLQLRVQICSCRFAMVVIANLRHAVGSGIRPCKPERPPRRLQIAIAVAIPTRPRWYPSNVDQPYLSNNRIRLASPGNWREEV